MHSEPENILIVDDDLHTVNFLKSVLEPDYIITSLKSGRELLENIEPKLLPDIILLDIMMQGINGFDVCNALKQNPKTENIPIVFITGLNDSADKSRALKLGAIDYITKPVDPNVLKSRIKNYLKIHHQDETLHQFIEEQKHNYLLLENSQTNLEKAQEIANLGSLEWDIVQNSIQTSKQLDIILGTHLPSSLGFKHFLTRVHPEDKAKIEQCLHDTMAKKAKTFEVEHRIVNYLTDNEIIVRTIAEFNYDEKGEPISMWATIQDITEAHYIHQELREHRDNLTQLVTERTAEIQGIVETAADGIITIDENGIIQSYNHAAEKIFQWTAEEMIGESVTLLMPEPHRSGHPQYIQHYLSTGDAKIIGKGREITGLRKNGEGFPLYLSISHLKLNKRHLFTGIVSDNSFYEKHQAELALAKEVAEQANNAKSDFLANMSHEIRTPMNAIIGLTQVVLETELDSEQRKHLSTVYQSAQGLLNLLNEILDLSKLESGNMSLENLDFNLTQTIENAISPLKNQAEIKGLQLTTQFSDNLLPYRHGDSFRLQQVITNLVGNAIKFTQHGRVSLTVEEVIEREKTLLHFSVIDTGIGIPEDHLNSIFNSFTQADTSTTRIFGGTGLGTTISKQLVELMGGHIWVESQLDVGSHFQFRLPLPPAKNIETCLKKQQEEKMLFVANRSLNILLVEDIQANIDLVVLRLEQMHHKITIARNGLEALNKFKPNYFDIILMDLQMPIMNGYDATIAIRKQDKNHATPIIALTASAMLQDRQKVVDVGMDGFVDKPIIFENLFAEMASLLPDLFSQQYYTTSPTIVGKQHPEFVNFKAIKAETALENWQEPEAFIKGLKSFAHKFQHCIEPLSDLIQQQNETAASELMHKLKGVSGNLGMLKLARLATELDHKLKQQQGNYQAHIEKIEHELENVLAEIITLPETATAANHVPINTQLWHSETVFPLVLELEHAFIDCDPDRSEKLLEQLTLYVGSKVLSSLWHLVEEFEFSHAEEELQRIIKAAYHDNNK